MSPSFQPLIQKATLSQREKEKIREEERQKQLDPYRYQLSQQRRIRNIQRRKDLEAERGLAWGDPVYGVTTPFLHSLDSAGQAEFSEVKRDAEGNPLETPIPLPTSKEILNFNLTRQELDEAIEESYNLTKPATKGAVLDTVMAKSEPAMHEAHHKRAMEALRKITALENGSGKDRKHANIRRILDTFGRHNTDHTVRQKGLTAKQIEGKEPKFDKVRGGPDTGSSEVQIAILTTKIRTLAKMYAGEKGNKDKHNKRNLRLLLHRRQRLLKYMERKERGSGRWEHMIEQLGLTPAAWKKQIEVR